MYAPALVLPYHFVPGQWYTLVAVFSQTCPAPPPGAGAALLVDVFGAGAGVDGGVESEGGGAAAEVFAGVVEAFTYHSLTPL